MVLEHVKQFIDHLIFFNLTYLCIYENICAKYSKYLITRSNLDRFNVFECVLKGFKLVSVLAGSKLTNI